jgi:hypothetical protein
VEGKEMTIFAALRSSVAHALFHPGCNLTLSRDRCTGTLHCNRVEREVFDLCQNFVLRYIALFGEVAVLMMHMVNLGKTTHTFNLSRQVHLSTVHFSTFFICCCCRPFVELQ